MAATIRTGLLFRAGDELLRSTPTGDGNYIVLGCVGFDGQGSSQFTIVESRGTPPAQYRLQGDADLLKFHVGHTVGIGGPMTPAAAGAKMPTLGVKALTYVSRTCTKAK
jgi:hypothetical protein